MRDLIENPSMEQLDILRCQVWKSDLCPKGPISVQRFKEAYADWPLLDTNEISRRCPTAPSTHFKCLIKFST
jgi:hypothetical protein